MITQPTCVHSVSAILQTKFKLYLLKYSMGPKVIKPFSWSIQLSMKFKLLINVKMPTIVEILKYISTFSRIDTSGFESKKSLYLSAF